MLQEYLRLSVQDTLGTFRGRAAAVAVAQRDTELLAGPLLLPRRDEAYCCAVDCKVCFEALKCRVGEFCRMWSRPDPRGRDSRLVLVIQP